MPDTMPNANEVPLTEAAMVVRESYITTRNMILRGELRGRKIGRNWFVDCDDAKRVAAARQPVAATA